MYQFDEEKIREALSTRLSLPDQVLTRVVDQLGQLHIEDVMLDDVRPEPNAVPKALVMQFEVAPNRLEQIIAIAGQLKDLKDITIFPQGIVAPRNWRVNIGMRM